MHDSHLRARNKFAFLVALFIANMLFASASAHDIEVHKEITRRAISQTYSLQNFLANVFGYDGAGMPKDPEFGQFTGSGWIVEGSEREDDDIRPFNHFYDPIDKKGLTDFIVPIPIPNPYAYNSFAWATTEASVFEDVDQDPNYWNWPQARGYEYAALTSPSKSNRDKYFGYMFRAVGQVVHLLEDTSQPEHVRNTEHLSILSPLHSYIEEYGKANFPKIFSHPEAYYHANVLPYPSTHDGLKSLWDRNVLSSGLSDSGASDEYLGLAEFSNKNFLGIRSLYGELESFGGIHHYAHPSLNETNAESVVEAFGTVGVNTTVDKDGVVRNGIYISKMTNGLKVRCHSRLTYIGWGGVGAPRGPDEIFIGNYRAAFTIHDDRIEKEYLEVLLPLAVDYSKACIDYFFRAGLWCETTWDNYSQTMVVYIHNNSPGFCTLKGGEFEMYWDDENGTRHKLDDFVYDKSELKFGEFATGTFRAPPGKIQSRNCMVVYRGNALHSESSMVDPVDDGMAIAACQVWLPAILQVLDRNTTIQVTISGVQGHSQSSAIVDVSGINSTLTFQLGNVFIATFYSPDVVSGVTVGYEMIDSPLWSEKYYDTISQQMKTITGHFEGDLDFFDWGDNNPHPEVSCWIHSALEGFSSDSASGTSDQIILQNRNDPTTTEGGINGTATVLLKTN